MTFEYLKSEHIPLITAFQKPNFPDGWNESQLLGAFNTEGFYFLACIEKERILGFVSYNILYDSADILDIVTDREFRGQKIATSLMQKCLNHLGESGVKKVFLEVRKKNEIAKNLYTKFGFNLIQTRKKYYSDGEDGLVYQKELT